MDHPAPLPRPAATIVVARQGERGVEVLTLRRSPGSRFAPGFVVFPGGTVDAEDAALAERLFGDREEAARACALRELYEETGLVLTSGGLREELPGWPIESVEFEPPPAEELVEISRWIAPEILEVRFDARFFAARAEAGLRLVPDGTEIAEASWSRAAEVLSRNAAGESPLMWPTLVLLQVLATCATVEQVLALRVQQVEPPIAITRRRAEPLREVGP